MGLILSVWIVKSLILDNIVKNLLDYYLISGFILVYIVCKMILDFTEVFNLCVFYGKL